MSGDPKCPRVVGEERHDAGENTTCIDEHAADRPLAGGRVAGEDEGDDPEGELDDDREAREHSRRGEERRTSTLPLEEQDDKGREADGGRKDVVEEQRRERQQERPGPEQYGRRQPVAGDDALDHHEHQQQEEKHRQDGAEQVQLPQPLSVAVLGRKRRVLQADAPEREVPRQGEHRKPGGLRREVLAVHVRSIDRLARIDLRGARRERADERVVRCLVGPAVLHDERAREREAEQGRHNRRSRPGWVRGRHARPDRTFPGVIDYRPVDRSRSSE